MTENWKQFRLKKNQIIFGSKTTKENIQHFKIWNFLIFSTFVGNFCPPGSESRFRIQIRIHWFDWIRNRDPVFNGLMDRTRIRIIYSTNSLYWFPFIKKYSRFLWLNSYYDLHNMIYAIIFTLFLKRFLWKSSRTLASHQFTLDLLTIYKHYDIYHTVLSYFLLLLEL